MRAVLLIEDDKQLQKATKRMLERKLEAIVTVAESPRDAIALLGTIQYDLIVSDFNIVGGTGADVLAHVATLYPYMLKRFVFFSGNEHDCMHYHDKFIKKGVWPEEFFAKLFAMVPEVVP